MATAPTHVTITVTPEMIAQHLWERDHLTRRGTPEYDLVLDIVKHKSLVLDEHGRRINGRYIKVAFIQFDEQGRPAIDNGDFIITKWKRVRIPKSHPWRGKRPTR